MKGGDSAFKAQLEQEQKGKCFNCGGDHWVRDRDKPKDEKEIKDNRNKSRNKNKSTSNKKTGKYSNPHPEECGRRMIDGEEHYYHHNSHKWKVYNKPQPMVAVAQPSEGDKSTSNVTTGSGSKDASQLAEEQRTLANAKKSFKASLEGLMAQLA